MSVEAALLARIAALAGQGHRPVIGLNGPVGAGKSTLARRLAQQAAGQGLRLAVASIDDAYLPWQQRLQALAGNPFGVDRVPPGSHEPGLLVEAIDHWRRSSDGQLRLPRFDKRLRQGAGDRSGFSHERADGLLLEGWLIGCQPLGTPSNGFPSLLGRAPASPTLATPTLDAPSNDPSNDTALTGFAPNGFAANGFAPMGEAQGTDAPQPDAPTGPVPTQPGPWQIALMKPWPAEAGLTLAGAPLLTRAELDWLPHWDRALGGYQSLWQRLDGLWLLWPIDWRLPRRWRFQAEAQQRRAGGGWLRAIQLDGLVRASLASLPPQLYLQPLLARADQVLWLDRRRRVQWQGPGPDFHPGQAPIDAPTLSKQSLSRQSMQGEA